MKYPMLEGLGITAHSIFCVGRNYADHAREMGQQVPGEPLIFLKPLSALSPSGEVISLPERSNEVHHEAELVVAISKKGKNIPVKSALKYIAGFAIGIDFTARDIQKIAKEKGTPWSVAKGFDQFAPLSSFLPFEGVKIPEFEIELNVNGEIRQKASTSLMIFDIPTLISYLSEIFTLQEGDLIFTGTPAGVSAVQSGDNIKATLNNGLKMVEVTIK